MKVKKKIAVQGVLRISLIMLLLFCLVIIKALWGEMESAVAMFLLITGVIQLVMDYIPIHLSYIYEKELEKEREVVNVYEDNRNY